MKKSIFVLLILTVFCTVLPSQSKQKPTIVAEDIYQAREGILVIGETDLLCSYFVTKKITGTCRFIGSMKLDQNRIVFSDTDPMVIDKGAKDKIKEGDVFTILARGHKVYNQLTGKKLGTYFLKKGQAVVKTMYEDKSIVTLQNCCFPVELTDLLLPLEKKGEHIWKKWIDYKRSLLPESSVEGNVVYNSAFMDLEKVAPGPESYVTSDLGKAFVSRGDYVLFYKFLSRKLPPLIIGSGVVVDARNTNSTVRVIDAGEVIEVGTKMVLLPEDKSAAGFGDGDEIPVIDFDPESDADSGTVEEGGIEVDFFFTLDEKTVNGKFDKQVEEIRKYITGKSEYRMILRGYTCSIGGQEYNLKLSQERVEAIQKLFMQELGTKAEQMKASYYGEKDPPAGNTTEKDRRKNRVVKVQVIGR